MLLATNQWNELIARYIIENYSRPFDMMLDGFSDSTVAKQVGTELLRCTEPQSKVVNLYNYMRSMPDNLFNLICLDADTLLPMSPSDQRESLVQTLRILSPGGYCTFLITDSVRYGKIVPNGFQLVHRFLANRFKVVTIIDQHSSQGLPFQLAPHQYLAVFQKPMDIKKLISRQNLAPSRISIL